MKDGDESFKTTSPARRLVGTFELRAVTTRKPCCHQETARCRSYSFQFIVCQRQSLQVLEYSQTPSFKSQASPGFYGLRMCVMAIICIAPIRRENNLQTN